MDDSSARERTTMHDGGPDIIDYAPVSRWALASLVAGLASVLALAGKPFWFLPPIGVVCGVVGLVRIARAGGSTGGRRAAQAGLIAALFFGVWAFTADFTRQRALAELAERHTQAWFRLVFAGRLPAAHRLTLPSGHRHRAQAASAAAQSGSPPDVRERMAYEGFLKQEPIAALLEFGADAHCRIERTESIHTHGMTDVCVQRVVIEPPGGGRLAPLPLRVYLQRDFDPRHNEAFWHLVRVAKQD